MILPTYNRAHLLRRALLSALQQTGVEAEIIVVDDASTDATGQVLQQYRDPRLRCIRHPDHRGASAARNTGIQASQGQWIAFLDSDDEWLPGFLQMLALRFQACSPQVGVVFTSFQRIQGGCSVAVPGRPRRLLAHLPFKRYQLNGDLSSALQRGNFITLQAAMLRRKCFERVGLFDERLPRLQDWEFWLRLAPHFSFAWIDQPLVRVYAAGERISSAAQALPAVLQTILEKHTGPAATELVAHCHFILGDFYMQQGKLHSARAHLWQAVRASPTTLLYWLAGLAAMHPTLYNWLLGQAGFRYTPD